MERFLSKVLIYGVVFISLLMLITYCTDKGLRKSDFGALKEWREILSGNVDADIVVNGSSRAWVQYNTTMMDSLMQIDAYNLGMDGAAFDIQYVRWKALLAHNRMPGMVLQNVDQDLLDKSEVVFRKFEFMPFLEDVALKEALASQKVINYSERFLPFLKYAGQPQAMRIALEAHTGKNLYTSNKRSGFAGQDAEWDGTNMEMQKKSGQRAWRVHPELLELFVTFIEECKSNNIRLILVFAPVYHEMPLLIADFEASRQFYRELAEHHQLQFIDLSMSELSYDQSMFYSASHLNARGANQFTSILIDELQKVY